MKIVRTIAELELAGTVGLVPTMGALHDGHRSLFRAARAENDVVVASLFVNAAQFGDAADLAAYPRDEERDAEIARAGRRRRPVRAERGRDLPAGLRHLGRRRGHRRRGRGAPRSLPRRRDRLPEALQHRPPERAYFGQKDAQQAAVIRRVVRDLNLDVEIRVLPTVRDDDGLALSSRNVRLSTEERERALALPRALARGAETYTRAATQSPPPAVPSTA